MWSLRQCSHIVPMGSVKVWQDATDRHSLLFQHPRIMAWLFGVGVPCALLNMRRDGNFVDVFVVQLSYARWLELWESPNTGSPIPISRFIAQCPNFPRSGGSSGSTNRGSGGSTSHGQESAGNDDLGSASGGSQREREGDSPARDRGRSDDTRNLTFLSDDGEGPSKLRITVIVGNEPGEGIAADSCLILARNQEHSDLSGQIEFVFSEHQPPVALAQHKRRKMEVKITAHYHVPGCCLIEPAPHQTVGKSSGQFVAYASVVVQTTVGTSGELAAHGDAGHGDAGQETGVPQAILQAVGTSGQHGGLEPTCEQTDVHVFGTSGQRGVATGHAQLPAPHGLVGPSGQLRVAATHRPASQHLQHVGIVHDNLCVHFNCIETPIGSILIANEALSIDTIDLTTKEGKSKQRGWDGGMALGGSSIAKGDIRHTRASSSLKETDTLAKSNVIAGTQFQLWDTCHKSATEQVLSYRAVHKPSIDSISALEEVGLDSIPKESVTSDVAMPVDLSCKGEFLVVGSGFKKHVFEMARTLGEFQIKVNQGVAKKFLHRFRPSLPISRPLLLRAKQNLQIEFIVNHDFELDMYRDGHLYWLLIGVVEPAPVPRVLDVSGGGV